MVLVDYLEFYKGNKLVHVHILEDSSCHIGNDGTGFAQLRLDFLAGGCKVSVWKGYSD